MMDIPELGNQVAYWDKVAWNKTFTLPINLPLLHTHLPLDSHVLDFGCGYGRTCHELVSSGYSEITGVDSSSEMIRRASQLHPHVHFDVHTAADLPYPHQTFDAILLVAVLTCIPSDFEQRNLVDALNRILRTGGMLYAVDYALQSDERNRIRYTRDADEFGEYGIFRLDEGGVFRHHSLEWIRALFADFTAVDMSHVDVVTMNGNAARAFQYLCRKNG